MIGKLFTDRIPVGFDNRDIPFVIKPDRAGMNPYQFRNSDRVFLLRQDNSSYKR